MNYRVTPFTALNQLSHELNRFFDDRPFGLLSSETNAFTPHVDISETDTGFQVYVDVPGVKPEDIEVSLHKGVLTIRGERKDEQEQTGKTFSRKERFHGTFFRQFNLPASADQETVSAKAVNGVLEIAIPKGQKAKPVSISVEGE